MSLLSAPRRFCAPSFLRPAVPALVRLLLTAALVCPVLLRSAPAIAQNGAFVPAYSNGTVTVNTGTPSPFQPSNTAWVGSGGANFAPDASGKATTATVTGTGPLTATLNWRVSGPGPIPTCVVAKQVSTVQWGASVGGNGTLNNSGSTGLSPGLSSTASSASLTSTVYTGPSLSGTSVSLPACSAQVKLSGSSGTVSGTSGQESLTITYAASGFPISISLGGATKDSNGNYNILVGQGCTASLSGIPSDCTVSNYQWSVSGTTFQDWEPTTPKIGTAPANPQASYFLGGSGPLTNPTAHWYWNDPNQTTETVTCTATVTPSAGQGAAFPVTTTQKVSVQLPTWTATGTGGYVQVNTKAPRDPNYEVWVGPLVSNGKNSGMDWKASVFTPTTPSFGTGSLEIVQLVTPNESWTLNTVPPQSQSSPDNNITELDGTCPYGAVVAESAQPMMDGDNPGIPLTSGSTTIRTSATDKDSFIDYLLYMPPVPATTDSNFPACRWITLAQFDWSINGSAKIPGTGKWSDYVTQNHSDAAIPSTVTPSGTAPFAGVVGPDFFPSWTRVSPP